MREWRCQEQEGRLGSGGSGTDAKRARFSRKRCCSVALLAISRYQARYLARVLIIMLILHVEFESFLSCFSALAFFYNLPNIKTPLASSRYLSFAVPVNRLAAWHLIARAGVAKRDGGRPRFHL